MSYQVYLGTMLLPVTPSKIQTKINSNNATATLINDGEISLLKKAGLTTVSFDMLLPNVEYPFAVYKNGFVRAQTFLDQLENLKGEGTTFYFKVARALPQGTTLHATEMLVSLEDYTIQDDASQGFDIVVSVNLKQYRDVATKTIDLSTASDGTTTATITETRTSDPAQIGIGSTVVVTGTLYGDSYGNNPGTSKTNYTGLVNFINLAGSHPYHITTPSGGWLGWVATSCVTGVS